MQSCQDKLRLESINFHGNKVGSATVTPVPKNHVADDADA